MPENREKIKKNVTKILTAVILIAVLLTTLFIWSNSIAGAEQSQSQSKGFYETIKPIVEAVIGEGNLTEHATRKFAHFSEFGLLGVEISILLILIKKIKFQNLVNAAFVGILVAFTDETIQIFTGRGPQIQDVWIDFSGFCVGILGVLFLRFLFLSIKKRKKQVN